jgi:hypothetical protein
VWVTCAIGDASAFRKLRVERQRGRPQHLLETGTCVPEVEVKLEVRRGESVLHARRSMPLLRQARPCPRRDALHCALMPR